MYAYNSVHSVLICFFSEHSTGILDAFQQCRLREQENLLKRLERLLVTTQDAAQVLIANAENARCE